MFSQLDQQHGAFTPCRTRSASPFPSRVASASTYLPRPQPFFYSLPPSYAFAKVFLEVRTVRPPFPPLFDRAMKISLRLASKLRPSEPCRCSSLSLSLFEDYFSIIFRCSYRSRKEEHIFLCPVFSSRSIEAGLRDRSSILQSRASFQFKIRGFSPRFIRIG